MSNLKGRKVILSQFTKNDMGDIGKVAVMINSAMITHMSNKAEIDYLLNYYKGVQPILRKEKLVRPEINNKLVVNHAQRITRTIVGYFLGNPIQYIQSGDTSIETVEEFNRLVGFEDKSAVDKEIGEYQSICGTAYRLIFTSSEDDVPFEDRALNPSNTFVIYENTIENLPLAGVTYLVNMNPDGSVKNYKYFIYTAIGQYTITTASDMSIDERAEAVFVNYDVGGVPMIEYPNNSWRIGDWELATSIMDSINKLESGRFDDVEQVVQSLLVFINADVDAETYTEMREQGVVLLKNTTGNESRVEIIKNTLDQLGMSSFSEELESVLDNLVGVPSRGKATSSVGGETGQAVELRDGWADLEIVARNKELIFKRSEKRTLKIIFTILKNKGVLNLTVRDIDIKFSRNKNHNLLVKSQSYSQLLETKTLSPSDCLTIVDLVSDVNEYVSRGEAYWGSPKDLVKEKTVVQEEVL